MRTHSLSALILVCTFLLIGSGCANDAKDTAQAAGSGSGADDPDDTPPTCEGDASAARATVWLCIDGMMCARCLETAETAFGLMDCLVSVDISLDDGGATVEYLDAYLNPQDIVDHLESETDFTVTCQEPV